MSLAPPHPHLFTRHDLLRMAEEGILDPEARVWRERFVLGEDEMCRPLARPETVIRVLDLLGMPRD